MPYMYTDTPETIDFIADVRIVDQIIDWFGRDIRIMPTTDEQKLRIHLKASPQAMIHWALQYLPYVEVESPDSLRAKIRDALQNGLQKYQ